MQSILPSTFESHMRVCMRDFLRASPCTHIYLLHGEYRLLYFDSVSKSAALLSSRFQVLDFPLRSPPRQTRRFCRPFHASGVHQDQKKYYLPVVSEYVSE